MTTSSTTSRKTTTKMATQKITETSGKMATITKVKTTSKTTKDLAPPPSPELEPWEHDFWDNEDDLDEISFWQSTKVSTSIPFYNERDDEDSTSASTSGNPYNAFEEPTMHQVLYCSGATHFDRRAWDAEREAPEEDSQSESCGETGREDDEDGDSDGEYSTSDNEGHRGNQAGGKNGGKRKSNRAKKSKNSRTDFDMDDLTGNTYENEDERYDLTKGLRLRHF